MSRRVPKEQLPLNLDHEKPFDGRESSILSLIAQSLSMLTTSDKLRILSELKGRALRVGKTLCGIVKSPSKADTYAADGFTSWVSSLGKKGEHRCAPRGEVGTGPWACLATSKCGCETLYRFQTREGARQFYRQTHPFKVGKVLDLRWTQ